MALPVDQIDMSDVVATLDPIWTSKPVLASRVQQRIAKVLSASIALRERSAPNPAAWADGLEHVLGRPKHQVRHHAALPVAGAPSAFAKLWAKRDAGQGQKGALIVLMTALRSGEVRKLQWGDIDDAMIAIPADRMKARKPHRVPVTPVLARLLDGLPRLDRTDLVLPSSRLGVVSDMTLAMALRRVEIAGTVHGLRSTFSDRANGEGWRRELIEDQLAHQIGSEVERAYRRGDFAEQRREMMDAWEHYLTKGVATSGD